MKIYSSKDCMKCQLACRILNNFGIPFEYIDNETEVIDISKTTGLKELPILVNTNGEFFSGQKAIQFIASLKPNN